MMRGARIAGAPKRAVRGMIACSSGIAVATAHEILRRGGTAVDAAIAASAVSCVVHPHAAGLGGDGFWMIHDPTEGGVRAINGSGPAAQLATPDYYRGRGHDVSIPARGPLAALTVPGAVDVWRLAHERWTRIEWADLFTDAIRYARDGVPIDRTLGGAILDAAPVIERHPSVGRIFRPRGELRKEGERFAQPELARSIERIAEAGAREGFYEGEAAERICAALEAGGSPLRPDDFAAYQAEWTAPISATYRGQTLYQIPPNSQGITALQILGLLEGFDVARWGGLSTAYLHHLAEAAKLALADRDAWVTDPKAATLPVGRLLETGYLETRRRRIDPDRALGGEDIEPGIPFRPSAFRSRRTPRAADGGEGELDDRMGGGERSASRRSTGGSTEVVCVMDEEGLVVVAVQSVHDPFGSVEVAGETGILLHNRGRVFQLDEDRADRLEPGKRPLHTLMPAMVFQDHRPWLVLGTTGGASQPQLQAELVTQLLDFGCDVQASIDAPRWAVELGSDGRSPALVLEMGVPGDVVDELRGMGHEVERQPDWDAGLGHGYVIRIDWMAGVLEGGADPRGDGLALGY